MRSSLKRSLLLAGLLLALVASLEVVVRLRDAVLGYGFFSSYRSRIAHIKPLLPFLTFGFPLYAEQNGERYISSRHGELYPLAKRPGTVRIIALGGSTTECENVMRQYHTHYPLILQEMLRARLGRDPIEVINLGNSAYATPHFLIQLGLHALSWDPDIIILSENINDLTASYFPGFVPDYANKYSHEFYGIPNMQRQLSLANQLFRYSRLYWTVKDLQDELAYRYSDRYRIRRTAQGREPRAEAKAVFRRNLRSIIVLAKQKGIKVVLGTQPLQTSEEYFVRHNGFKPYNDIVVYPLHDEFVAHHHAYNQVIRDVGREEGVQVVDGDAIFGDRKELFIDHVHYTLEGAQLLARAYADRLIAARMVR